MTLLHILNPSSFSLYILNAHPQSSSLTFILHPHSSFSLFNLSPRCSFSILILILTLDPQSLSSLSSLFILNPHHIIRVLQLVLKILQKTFFSFFLKVLPHRKRNPLLEAKNRELPSKPLKIL